MENLMFLDIEAFEQHLVKFAAQKQEVLGSEKQFEKIKVNALDGLKSVFPIDGDKHKLVLRDAWVNDNLSADDYPKQKEAKLRDRRPVPSAGPLYVHNGPRQD